MAAPARVHRRDELHARWEGDVGVCSRTFDKNGPKDMVDKLPAVRAAIDAAREKILSGEIKVTNALESSG